MLPTFVIGLREGLEAALIVGIVAAFLRKQGRSDLIRWVLVGIGSAVALCVAGGVALRLLSRELPQREQEMLETVIGVIAVAMVTYMVLWMRRNARGLKGELEQHAAKALDGDSAGAKAMVVMAFLAVLREGFETVVFLLAAFNQSGASSDAPIGAALGIVVAIALGYGIYRGGVSINLARFFKFTGLVLVLVAAGLVATTLHTAHEAGWLDVGQGGTFDLSGVVEPGSVQASLLTGILGWQPYPVVIEVVGYLLYLVPVALYVAWPANRPIAPRRIATVLLAGGGAAVATAIALAVSAPSVTSAPAKAFGGGVDATVVSRDGDSAVVRATVVSPAASGADAGAAREIVLQPAEPAAAEAEGLPVLNYTATLEGNGATGRPASLPVTQIAELNGGRLPIGVRVERAGAVPATYTSANVLTVSVEPRTNTIVAAAWNESVRVTLKTANVGTVSLSRPVEQAEARLPDSAVGDALTTARARIAELDSRSTLMGRAWGTGLVGGAAMLLGGWIAFRSRQRPDVSELIRSPASTLMRS